MKKLLLLITLLLFAFISIGQIRYHSTNRLDYGKYIRVGYTYQLVYPEFYVWNLYLQSELDVDFWDWYYNYYMWYHTSFNYWYTYKYFSYYWYYDYYLRYESYLYYGYYHNYYWYHRPVHHNYGRRPDNKPVNVTRPRPERETKQIREDRISRENNRIREPERITKPRPERERQVNPTYRQPERESRPRYNDTRIRVGENNRPNRIEHGKPINSQRNSGRSENSNNNGRKR